MVERTYDVIVVDDNPLSREQLIEILSTYGNLRICADVGDFNTARQLFKERHYDIAFLGVQLDEDHTSFELVKLIPPATNIIFITGYDQFAIRAFEVNAQDYIVKPIVPERIDMSIKRVMGNSMGRIEESEEVEEAFETNDTIWLDAGDKQAMIPFSNLTVWSSQENYSDVYTVDRECYTVRRSLRKWEEMLPERFIIRVNRQLLVNAMHVKKITRTMGKHKVYVEGFEEPFDLSRRNSKDAKKKYEALLM
jgi:two-component system LytT family response regulator